MRPLNLTAFNEIIVEPMRNGIFASYDGGDQGIINTMLYGKLRLFGADFERHARLHPMYNVIARHAKHTEQKWRAKGSRVGNLTAGLLHFTRETRPWQIAPQVSNVTRAAEWARGCGSNLCKGLSRAGRFAAKNTTLSTRGSYVPPPSIGIHPLWETYCGLKNKTSVATRLSHNASTSRRHADWSQINDHID